mmetsp:Transcript_21142/g.24481  ORF Transcript_21142/g.24481 Transcript_21142/m.24481 type:complete len:91 (+) Transcript_21142:304-576(+)
MRLLAVEENLRRIQCIRPTEQAARQAAFQSKARQARSRHAPSWFNNYRTNQTFNEFYSFNTQFFPTFVSLLLIISIAKIKTNHSEFAIEK